MYSGGFESRLGRVGSVGVVLAVVFGVTGCSSPARTLSRDKYILGEYGESRAALVSCMESDEGKRSYLYDRMQLVLINLADGLPHAAAQSADEVFDTLRTQGINADRTVACFFTTEKGARFWKGEPFEQAMMFVYTALQKAMLEEWDNARAASLNALFMLTDFGENEKGARKRGEEIVRDACAREGENASADGLAAGYTAAPSNFALGFLVAGIANQVLGLADPDRAAEAQEHFRSAVAIHPELQTVVDRLQPGEFNTVLIVDCGLGPTKYRYGMDGVYSAFKQMRGWPSEGTPLRVDIVAAAEYAMSAETVLFPVTCDLNTMAQDHRWNNLEQLRVAKSRVGTAMLVGSGFAGSYNRWAGIGMAVGGALLKLTARADTTHCEILPQRVYVAPLLIASPGTTVHLRVGECDAAQLVLTGIDPPRPPERVQLRYVRMTPTPTPPAWATTGRTVYSNDWCRANTDGPALPYILGGHCVCKPTYEVLARYQAGGYLQDMTLEELKDLYLADGIVLDPAGDELAHCGPHVLEGGTSLECPLPGTAGYARLFGQEHPPYVPRSQAVQDVVARLQEKLQTAVASAGSRRGAAGEETH